MRLVPDSTLYIWVFGSVPPEISGRLSASASDCRYSSSAVGLRLGLAGDHEGGQAESQRCAVSWSGAQVLDDLHRLGERPTVDEEDIGVFGGQRAARLGFAADVQQRGVGRCRPNQRRLAAAITDRDLLARPQFGDDPEPFPRVRIPVVVVERVETQTLQFGQEPSGDEVDGQSSVGDVRDVGGDLREDQRVEQQWLDRADQLDA